MEFASFLSVYIIIRKTNLYKTQLHNHVTNFDLIEKNVDAQKAFFGKKYVFLCGTRIDKNFVNLNK